jgi:hypothetical protein
MTQRTTDTTPLPVCADPRFDGRGPLDRRVRSALAGARERTASVADLREMIIAARPGITAAGSDTARRMELAHELRKILTELEPGRPDLAPVRERWKRIRDLLGPAAGSGPVAQVTDLLILLLRAGRPAARG